MTQKPRRLRTGTSRAAYPDYGRRPQDCATTTRGWQDPRCRRLGAMRNTGASETVVRQARELMGRREAAGAWPESIRRLLYAMIPTSKVENEAQLRNIGLLRYIYRVWMAIRKHQRRDWRLRFYGGAHLGAAAMASRRRASIELQHYRGPSTLLAFLDCSKCDERVGHAVAGSRAQVSGLPGRIASGLRVSGLRVSGLPGIAKAHGAVAPPQRGSRGLVAGCSFGGIPSRAAATVPDSIGPGLCR